MEERGQNRRLGLRGSTLDTLYLLFLVPKLNFDRRIIHRCIDPRSGI